MTALHCRVDTNQDWLTTYSRALCSRDEDSCWDYLLSTQSISIFSNPSEDSTSTSSPQRSDTAATRSSNRAKRSRTSSPAESPTERIDRWLESTPPVSLSLSSLPNASLYSDTNNNDCDNVNINNSIDFNKDAPETTIALLSPGRLSHALCKVGFDCIDYFTSTQDEFLSELPRPSSEPNRRWNESSPPYTSPMLNDLTNSDWRTGLAAAVSGKRAAALERKRALSRTMSQDEVAAITASVPAQRDPWFETLDRLARWDEVAYR